VLNNPENDYDAIKTTMNNYANIDLDAITNKVGVLDNLRYYDLNKL